MNNSYYKIIFSMFIFILFTGCNLNSEITNCQDMGVVNDLSDY